MFVCFCWPFCPKCARYPYKVNQGLLSHDILMGDKSPWNIPKGVGLFSIPLLPARFYALSMVNNWVPIFEALHNNPNGSSTCVMPQ